MKKAGIVELGPPKGKGIRAPEKRYGLRRNSPTD
jgi:hypothetical protein